VSEQKQAKQARLEAFVAKHKDNPPQRSAGWLENKRWTVGGSEVAALMGKNPYSRAHDVVAAKAGIRVFRGAAACDWGTFFEAIVEKVVEVDCGTALVGTDISVPAPAGPLEGLHANSPDGYGLIELYQAGGEWRLLRTDEETGRAAAGRPRKTVAALFEFKCPHTRAPKGGIPAQYTPQIWSGLALAPVADQGLYVDAVFRKCPLAALGPQPGHDGAYHSKDAPRRQEAPPEAWGLAAIYAPLGAKGGLSYEAWELCSLARDSGPPLSYAAIPVAAYEPLDLGAAPKAAFEKALALCARGSFRAGHAGPFFADGRGAEEGWTAEGQAERWRAAPPPGHHLAAVVPWKLLEIAYASEGPRPGFAEEVAPLMKECLGAAGRIRAAESPARAYAAYAAEARGRRQKEKGVNRETAELFSQLYG
jgi:hypothetical protein